MSMISTSAPGRVISGGQQVVVDAGSGPGYRVRQERVAVLLYRTFVAFALPLARVSIVVGITLFISLDPLKPIISQLWPTRHLPPVVR
jgi:hypothetical protein